MLHDFFKILFNKEEETCVGSLYETKLCLPGLKSGEFYCINPLASVDRGCENKREYSYLIPRRADINVDKFRNFLFEMDDVELDEQLSILNKTNIPWSGIVFSGNKSYHALLSLEDCLGGSGTEEGIEAYKVVWSRLAGLVNKVANKVVVDESCKNPSRLSRYPEFKANGRARQSIIKLGSRVSTEDFLQILSKCPEVKRVSIVSQTSSLSVNSVEEFWEWCPEGLENMIKNVPFASEAGVYPYLYRIALWAIDSVNPGIDVLETVLREYTFPRLKEAGYPSYKNMVAIVHAYKSKGLL